MNLESIYNSVIEGAIPEVETGVQTALDEGIDPAKILTDTLVAALPTLLIFVILGRYFMRGLLAGSLKG